MHGQDNCSRAFGLRSYSQNFDCFARLTFTPFLHDGETTDARIVVFDPSI